MFYNQFIEVLRKLGCKLIGNELNAIYINIDTGKKLYFNQEDYQEGIKRIYFNIYKKTIEFTEDIFILKDKLKADLENIYILGDNDKQMVIYHILRRFNEYITKNGIIKEELLSFIANRNSQNMKRVEYLHLNKVNSLLKTEVYLGISKFEIELFRVFLDIDNVKLVFKEEFDTRIIASINLIINNEALNVVDPSAKENKNSLATIPKKVYIFED